MATINSDICKASFVPATRPQGAIMGYPFSVTIPTTIANADVIRLAPIPKGATLLTFWIYLPDIDTGSTTAAFSVGDKGTAALFVASTTLAASTAVTISPQAIADTDVPGVIGIIAGTLPKLYSVYSDLRITMTATPNALGASVVCRGWYQYTMYPTRKDPGQ